MIGTKATLAPVKLEGEKKAREGDTRGERAPARRAPENRSLTPRVPPSRAPVLSFARYFQAPAT